MAFNDEGTRFPTTRILPLLVLAGGVALSALLAWQAGAAARAREGLRFINLVGRTQDTILNRLELYTGLLRGGAAHLAAAPSVGRREFHTYVERLELKQRYPGIQGIGYTAVVRPGEAAALVTRMRADGVPGFHIWPSRAGEQHAILYLEPPDVRNLKAIGFDMASEHNRRMAMERARDLGTAAASGKVRLVQEIFEQKQAGFLIYVPVYRGGGVPLTVAARRRDLLGYVYSPFRADDLFRGIFGSERLPRIAFRIYDGADPVESALLHASDAGHPHRGYRPQFESSQQVDIAGRPWTIRYATRPEFDASALATAGPVALGTGLLGLLLTGLLTSLTWVQVSGRGRAERSAAALRTSETEVRAQRERWRTTLASIADAVIVTDTEGKVTFLNGAAEALTGWPLSEALLQPLPQVLRILDQRTRRPAEDWSAAVLRAGRAVGPVHHLLVPRNGDERPIEQSAAPVRDDRGDITGLALVFRDVTERVRTERRQALEHAVTQALLEEQTLEDAAPRILQAACEHLVFDWGALWQLDERGEALRFVRGWGRRPPETSAFEEQSRSLALRPGEGLPGQVWERREPVWHPDFVQADRFPRIAAAQAGRLHGAFGYPIVLGGQVVGVLEFFSSEVREPTPELLALLGTIAVQVGLFLERSRAETALRQTEALQAAIVETATDCIITIDHESRVLEWNPAAERTFGYPRPEVLGKSMAELIIPERYREAHHRGLNRYLETGEGSVLGRRVELEAQRADGTEFPAEISIAVIRTGGAPCFTAHLRDISARRRAEEQLRLHARVLDSMAEGVSVADEQGVIIYTNPTEDRMFGYPPGELLGRHVTVQNDHPPEENERIVGRVIQQVQAEGSWSGEWRNRKKDGTPFTTFAHISLLEAAGKRYFVCVQGDITEQKRAEEAIRASEARFRVMADSAPVLIWLTDRENRATWFNRPWLEFTGRPLEQELGSGWVDGVHPDDLPSALAARHRCVEAREPFTMELRLRRADGEWRWVLDNGVPLYDAEGAFAGYIGSCVDITERRDAEEALRAANRQKDAFLAMLAHELRNPLGAMSNALYLLQHAAPDSPARSRALDTISRQVTHQAHLVNDLLDVSRIARGKMELRREPVDLSALVRETVADYHCRPEGPPVRLTVTSESPVPVLGDATRLNQVLSNLVDNACKFTPAEGEIHVSLDLDPDAREATVSVSDSGVGIEPALLRHIFEPFTQAEQALDRTRGGLGLGLALVHGLVEMHGGRVSAESPGLGKGATFRFTLPVAAALPEGNGKAAGSGARARSLRVLVVEDNPDAAATLEDVLDLEGHQVRLAATGPAGLEAALQFHPEVVLCDIGLPGMDGYEVAARLRQNPETAAARLIAVTGYGSDEDRRRTAAAGFERHLTKPLEISELNAVLLEIASEAPRLAPAGRETRSA